MVSIAENPNEINTLDITDPASWPLWLELREVAQVLRLHEKSIYRLHAIGKLRGRKFGGALRFHRDLVCQFNP